MRQTVYVLCGMPGAGKSTFCKKHLPNCKVVSRDLIRVELGYTPSIDDKYVGTKNQEQQVTIRENQLIKEYLEAGYDIVLDNMNGGKYLKPTVDYIKSIAPENENEAYLESYEMPGSYYMTVGDDLELPDKVQVTDSNGEQEELAVNWNEEELSGSI